ncbi:armadillo-type protein [Gorgonomyces haynaldii]|nr:armadillo-type protein [Gorgonomyces haynaldii]
MEVIQRDLNILGEPTSDRIAKRRALEHIQKEITKIQDLSPLLSQVGKTVLKSLSDPVEKCRELSIAILQHFIQSLEQPQPMLVYLVPVFVQQLGQLEMVEPSEEMRLQILKTLHLVSKKTQKDFSPFVEDTIKILQRTLADPFPDVKKEACHLVTVLCLNNPQAVKYHSKNLVQSLAPVIMHKHSSVRVIALSALTQVILVDADGLDDILQPLKELTFDKSPAVREAVYTLARDWMTKLIDRYTYGYKILPLLLAGLTDDMPKLKQTSIGFMDQVGQLYEQEWEDRIKDEMDYTDGWNHLLDRPRVGTRHLARDNTQKTINAFVEGIQDWNADVRSKSYQNLEAFIRMTEDQITGYVGVIMPPSYKTLAGDESHVMDSCLKMLKTLAIYVKPETSLDHVFAALSGQASGFKLGCLRALVSLVSGSTPEPLQGQIHKIVEHLSDKELLTSDNMPILLELSKCAHQTILKLLHLDSFGIFMVLLHLLSVKGTDKVPGYSEMHQTAETSIQLLAQKHSLTREGLFSLYFEKTLETLAKTQQQWIKHSPEPRLLQVCCHNLGDISPFLHKLLPFVALLATMDRDPEVRQSVFETLIPLYQSASASLVSQTIQETDLIVKEIICRNLVWKAGQKNTFIRGQATQLLLLLIQHQMIQYDRLLPEFESHVVPLLISNMDDDLVLTRKQMLQVFDGLLSKNDLWNVPVYKKLYPELLKRMDDANDDIRVECAKTWKQFFASLNHWIHKMQPRHRELDPTLSQLAHLENGQLIEFALEQGHYETIVKGLTLHMDDMNAKIQEAVCDALKTGNGHPIPTDILREHLNAVKSQHRTTAFIDRILAV